MATKYSWLDCKTQQPIQVNAQKPAYLLIPKAFGGGHVTEPNYQGNGLFGGKNVFELITKWNAPKRFSEDSFRNIINGANLSFGNERNLYLKYPIKITYDKSAVYENEFPSLIDIMDGQQTMPVDVQKMYQKLWDAFEHISPDSFSIELLTINGEYAKSYQEAATLNLNVYDAEIGGMRQIYSTVAISRNDEPNLDDSAENDSYDIEDVEDDY